jgi:biopolymer transport protein ExbB/TolQ
MFDSSKDILYMVLAFASLWVAVFLCWTLYYVVQLLRNANEIVEEVRERAHRLEEMVRMIRERMESMSGMVTLAAQGIGKLVGKAIEKKLAGDDEDEESPRSARNKRK